MIFGDSFQISPKTKEIQRQVYDFFALCGNVGGVMSVFIGVTSFILQPYTEQAFQVNAIQKVMQVEKKEKVKDITLCDRLKLLTKINPSKDHVMIMEKGVPMIDQ
jgi:hypothetical protein